ncbi:MAG: restriction endonuclease subunit S [Treponema sp.]|nr:restriction endonuclease subunit S [Treponema sp.]
MKDSGIKWVGNIPNTWEVQRFKNVMHKDKKICEHYQGQDIISLTMNGVIKRDLENPSGKMPTTWDGYQFVEPEDLLLCLFDIDVTPRCVGLVKDAGLTSPAYSRFKVHKGYYNAYYDYLLRWIDDEKIFIHLSKNLRSSLTEDDFGAIHTIVPPLPEQQKIAAFLDKKCTEIDSVLTKTKESIEEYKLLKNAIITQAVTKGIRPNRKMKESGIEWIGEIPEDWDCFYLSQIFAPVKNKNVGLQENNLLSLSYGKIIRKNIDTTFGLLPENFEGYNIIEANDLVLRLTDLQNDHKSLRVGLAKEKGIITSAYLSLRNKSNNLPFYFYYLLHTFDILKGFYGMGAGVRQGLNWDEVRSLRITAPKDISEQKEIVDYLEEKCSQIEILIKKKEQLITELETYKKSLIYEYVTGKKEVQ